MPIYEYQVMNQLKGCDTCKKVFTYIQKINDPPLKKCPVCGQEVKKLISAPNIGASVSSFDQKARNAGFHKFKRLGKGEYEKKY